MMGRSSSLSLLLASIAGLSCAGLANAQSSTISVAAVNPACPLDCKGDATCVRGNADFSSFSTTENTMPFLKDVNQDGYYCQCPPGRTGLLCEREFESCGDGLHFCFHGGKCLHGLKDVYGNDQFYCDCGDAEMDGTPYSGRFCEAEAVDVCGEGAAYGKIFCTNGKCRENFLDYLDQPCICDSGWEGSHCEYKTGEQPACDLECSNGGHCQIGSKDYPPNELYREFWKTHDDYRFCVCPENFFGLQCEIEGDKCGDGHCFNGGTCVSQMLSDGTKKEFCDCTTAQGKFAGMYCEAESTSFCNSLTDNNGRQFCVNGGACKADSHLGCDCLEGFSGPICEFRDSVVDSTECNLNCQNMGVCRNGAKDVSFLKKFNVDMPNVDLSYSDDFEHCVCPKGYVGLKCEHMVDVCPGGEHVCMNGAECIPDDSDGRLKYKCDCDAIRLPFDKYAGEFCELKSSELCTFNGRPGTGLNKDAFCVNGGKCLHHVNEHQPHPGCQCSTGFEGAHCESLSAERNNPEVVDEENEGDAGNAEEKDGLSTAGIILLVVFGDLVILGAIGAYIYMRRQRRQRDMENEFGMARPKNLMDPDDAPEPPTLGELYDSMGNLPDNSERGSVCSGSGGSIHDNSTRSHRSSVRGADGLFKVENEVDLVNVAIL